MEEYLEERWFGIKHPKEEDKEKEDELGYNAKRAEFTDMYDDWKKPSQHEDGDKENDKDDKDDDDLEKSLEFIDEFKI